MTYPMSHDETQAYEADDLTNDFRVAYFTQLECERIVRRVNRIAIASYFVIAVATAFIAGMYVGGA